VANTGGTAASITYNTTSGDKSSTITMGALSIATGTNLSAINYIAKSSGSPINPNTIGSSSVPLPGYILLDNTYGCSGANCTQITGFINTTTNNLATLATSSVGITINNLIYAKNSITANGVSNNNQGVGYSVALTSTNGAVILNGGTTNNYGVYAGSASITANSITVTGTSSVAAAWNVYLGALTINSAATGGSITITGSVIGTPGATGGIYQAGAITGANGSSISFISNNNINQNGAISLPANTSGTAANITYDVTSGNKTSTISATGTLNLTAGSTSAINYIEIASGAALTTSPIGSSSVPLPGYVLFDNTYGCAGSGCTPVSGYINSALSAWATLVTTSNGINLTGNIFALNSITINAVNAGGGSGGGAILLQSGLTSTSANINLLGTTTTGFAVTNYNGGGWGISPITANSGAVNITGTSTTTGDGVYLGPNNSISAKSITVIGSEVGGTYAVYLNTLTIVAGGTNLNVTGTVGATTHTGIYLAGAITDNAVGSNISFITNGIINQTGAIALVANTGGTAANITFDTTSGNKSSNITTGALTIASGTNTSGINFIAKSAGSNINPGAIGSASVALPGYASLDNTFGCTGTGCTPATGFINTTTNNLASLATTSIGLTINNAIYAAGAITESGVSSGSQGIGYSAVMTSTGSNIALTGGTTTGYGIYSTSSLVTANNIVMTGTSSGAPSWDVYIGPLTINTGAIGGSITITGNVIATPGTAGGIYQSGAITGVSGSNISFISNNNISQNGAISLAANTSGTASNITYDTTTGNKTSTISSAGLTIAAGSTSAINYIIKTNGGTISPPAITVPGYILLDNTCLGCVTAATPTTAAVNGAAITLGGALSAGTLAGTTGVTVNAVANGTGNGFNQGANTITSSAGGVTITVNAQAGGTAYYSTGAITATGQAVTINTTTTTGVGINDTGAITAGVVTITGSQTTATATATVVTVTGLITANSVTITGNGGAASTIVSLGAVTINAGGGNLTVTANNVAAGGTTGITQTGTITDNAVGSNITFTSNNIINQTGAIALVANTGTPIANVIYDTTRGTRASNITGGALTFTSGANSIINYIAKSAGSVIDPDAIGTSSLSLPGYVLLDNTFGCTGTGCTPVSGFINPTTNNLSTLATATNVGIAINNAIYATGNIVINGVSSNSSGVNYSAVIRTTDGAITITGSSTANFGIYASNAAAVMSATNATYGVITFNGHSTAVSSQAINTVASATITGAAGVYLTGLGSSGNITAGALIQNSGTSGGVIVDAIGNVSLAGVTNYGADGIRITGGDGIAAGTTTGGNVTAVGTITNTGGVVGISMAAPENAACTTGCTIANAIGITTANADATKNISYGILGGALLKASGYVSGNFINYRQRLSNTLAISVTLNSNYSAAYGTGYNSASANAWLQANSTVSYTGSITASFGVTTTTPAYVKSVLMFSPTVGGTTASNGTSANAVQTNTALTAASVSATDGSAVTVVPAGRTYSITPTVLGITVSGVYNGTTSYSNQNATIVTTGLAAWDTITNVTVSSANANAASTIVTAIAGTATGVNTFSSLNYLINGVFNGTLTSGLPVNTTQGAATNRVTITPAPLGLTINAVYSGSTAVTPTSFTVTGLVNSQTITNISVATLNAINVSANNSNYVTAITIGSGTASIGNYVFNPAYNTVSSNTQNTITLIPKSLTVTGITISAKTYDGTKSATVSGGSLVGVATVDLANVTLAQTATFVSANAANNVALLMVDSISGSASANYTLIQPTGITANIAQKVLTVGGTTVAANKIYDATNAATISGGTLVGVIAADVANVNLLQSGTFAQSNVGNGISVTITDSLSGPLAANYILTQPANVTANITPKTLTVTGTTVANKVYNGSTTATVTGGTLVGVLSADTANVTLTKAGSFSSANAGNGIAVTINNSIAGSASANYALTQPTGVTSNITPAPLGIALTAGYSGSTAVTPTSFTLTGLVNGETISAISSATVANINVAGNSTNFVRSITISGGTALASNYAFNTAVSTTAGTGLNTVTLATKTLTVAGTLADSKVYDGTTSANVWGGSLVGVVGGDVVSLKQAGTFNSANVGSSVAITISDSISGASSTNYNLVQPTGVTAAITPKILTVSDGTVAHKTYDGTTNATLTGGALIGLVAGDAGSVTLVQAGSFSSPNVSNGIIIIVNDSITGSAAANYRLIQPAGITANITPAMLGISVVGVANGTNNITPISYTINGLINGQTITSLSSVTVSSSSISSNGSNFVTGIVISGGTALATNYAFSPSYNATAGISQNIATLVAQNQKILTVTGTVAVTKTYDGTNNIIITGGTLVGVTPGDSVTLVQSAVLINPNVSINASVVMNDSITGTSATNYILVQPTGITAIINAAPLGIAITGEYNGTTTITPASFTPTGLVAGETITGISSAVINSANVANNGSNFATSIVSSGGTASLSNYKLTPSYNATAGSNKNTVTLTPKALTVGGVSVASDKVYDATTSATLTGGSLVGVVGSDSVTLVQAGSFAQTGVGVSVAVTANNSLTGSAASNYSLMQPTGITANITPKALTVSGATVSNKVYDGTTTATITGGSLLGLVGTDGANVSLTQTASFASAAVANGILVTFLDSISGSAAGNYTLTQPSAVSMNITPKPITVTGTVVANKVYDTTTDATVTGGTLSGVITADLSNVTLTKAGTFSSARAGNGISVVINDSISGSAAGNYTLTQPTGVVANITQKALTITASNVTSVYGSTAGLGSSAFTSNGLLTGDSISAVALLYSGSAAIPTTVNAGTYNGVINASAAIGTGLANYAISYVAGNLSVGQATLTATPVTQSAVYNGNTLNGTTYSASAANYSITGYKNSDSGSNVTLSFTGSLGFTVGGSSASILNAGTYGYAPGNLVISTTNSNYQVVLASSLANQYLVTPATVSLSASKVYDGSTTFTAGAANTSFTVSTGIGSQTLGISGTATANSANVIGVSSLSTSGLTLANGTGLASNYILPVSTSNVLITPKTVTASISNQSKVYDTTTVATLTAGTSGTDGAYVLSGFVGSDSAYITQTVGSYNNANVASASTVSASIGSSLIAKGSTVLSNYALPSSASTVSGGGTITPAPLTMIANDASTYVGVLPTLTYQLTGLVGADTKNNAISNATITYSASLLDNAMNSPALNALTPYATSSNYSLTFVKGSLMVAGNYQMVVNAGSNNTSYGLINLGNASYLGNALTSSNNSVSAGYCTDCAPGKSSPNIISLEITVPSAGSNIWTAADSLGSGPGTGQGKYTFAITPTISSGSYVAGGSLQVGNYVLSPDSLTLVSGYTKNYTVPSIIYINGTLSVTPKALTVASTVVANKVYDGTTVASISSGQLVGVVASDVSNINLVQTGNFASANVGSSKVVTINDTLSGSVAANYVLTQPTGLSANITAAPVTIGGLSASNKVYDTTAVASLNGTAVIASGLLGSDTASLSGSAIAGSFASANVGTGIAVTANLSGLTLSNANYYVASVTSPLSANITAAPVTIGGLSAANKVYDTTTTATLSGTKSIDGLLASDSSSVSGIVSAQFSSADAGSGIAVTANLSGLTLSNSNYYVSGLTNPLSANITAAPVTIGGLSASNKVYDTTAVASLNGTAVIASGLLGSDTASLSGSAIAGSFASANVGTGIAVTANLSGLTLSNANYYVASVTSPLSANITAAPVTIGGLSAANKVYDTTTVATLTGSPVIASGLLGSDTATLSGSALAGTFASANAASGIVVTADISALKISNTNYYVAGIASPVTADITGKPVTIIASNQTGTYGTAIASLGSTAFSSGGFFGNDGVSSVALMYLGSNSVAGSVNAGTYSGGLVASNAVAKGGTILSNYSITYVAGNLVINAAPITVTADNQTMAYGSSSLPSLTYATTGLKNGDSPFTGGLATSATVFNGTPGTASNVGTYTINQGTLNAGSNYILNFVPAALTVNPAALVISANAQSSIYGSAFNLGTTSFSSSGLVNGDSVSSVTLTVTSNSIVPGTSNVGAYTIVSNTALGSRINNYNITYQTGVLTINPKPINVVANDATMVYADPSLPALTYLTVSGLVNGDMITGALSTSARAYSGSAGSASNVGIYAVNQGSLTAGNNYAITYTPANLTVNAANLIVTADSQTSTYGSLSIIAQTALASTGLRNGDYVNSANILYNGNQVIPGTINAGTYSSVIDISNAAGVGMTNYNITYAKASLVVNKAALLVTAVGDGKFVSQTDAAGSATNCNGSTCAGGYAGAMYSGLVNGDVVTGANTIPGLSALSITRSNVSTNAAGLYIGVLVPSGLNLQNYTAQYAAGDYVIAPAEQLLVKMGNNTSAYSAAPNYSSVTAAYLKADGNIISSIPVSVSGNTVSLNDSLNSSAQFTITVVNPANSSSGNLSVGNYALAASAPSITGSNFNSMAVVGSLNVTPKQLAYADLGIAGVTKVYDGSVYMNNLAITTPSGFVASDVISATAVGSFANKNVGSAIAYNLGVILNGADKANYQIAVDPLVNSGLYASNNGVITQLNSVTYTGPNSGGNWSNPANWTTTGTAAVGAIPDLSNVANVIIPVGTSVVYDNAVAGPVTSAVLNNGNVNFNLSSASNIAMPISGTGNVTISNSGAITLSGINPYTGGTILSAGSSLIVGNSSAIGAPNITSIGTSINPASLSTLSAVTLPYLNIIGGTTQLLSNITTTGAQTYSDLILGPTVSGTTTLRTSNANINFMGKIDGVTEKLQSLFANAGTGVVTMGDSIGSIARLNSITMTGSSINILADVITAFGQTYNGNTFIGDASYIGRTATVGFLFDGYNSYFQYSTPAITSSIKYLNMNPVNVRTLISEDPNVTFTGTVNDLVTNTHTLLVAAIAPDASAGSSAAASVNFGASVGDVSPLYSLNAQVVVNQSQANSVSNYVGTVSLVGNVATYSDQTYRASVMTAQAATQPGTVTFSVYDPSSSVTYLLPLLTSGAGAGQMNLQNPNSLDALSINGTNNYSAVQNRAGTNNWGAPATIANALGYVAPAYVPPAFVAPAYVPPAFVAPAYVPPAFVAPAYVPPAFVAPAYVPPAFVAPAYVPPAFVAPAYVPPAFVAPVVPTPIDPVAIINVPPAIPQIIAAAPIKVEIPAASNVTPSNAASIVAAIQNSGNFVFYAPSQNTTNVNVVMAPEINVSTGLNVIAGMQVMNRDAVIPKAEPGMVNILVKVVIDGVPSTLVSSSPIKGFKFIVPDALLPESIVAISPGTKTANPALVGVVERAVQSDGSPLPDWLKYDADTNTFSAKELPNGAKPIEIKIQSIRDGKILEESPPIVIDAK